jgi:hypothetical protein
VEAVIVTKNIKKILLFIFLGFALKGCSNTSPQSTSLLLEGPVKETVVKQEKPLPEKQTSGSYCYFIPPKGWDLADQAKLSPRVKICFIGKSSKSLLPSVNLAQEEVDVSLKTYIDIVKNDCLKDPNCKWRDLGKYNTPFGEGRLTEREIKTEWGPTRQIQLIVIKDKMAYILTAGTLKEEFSSHYKNIEAVLRSFTLSKNLITEVACADKRTRLREMTGQLHNDFKKIRESAVSAEIAFDGADFQDKTWKLFQQKIINDFTEMGAYWQILFLKHVQNQLLERDG